MKARKHWSKHRIMYYFMRREYRIARPVIEEAQINAMVYGVSGIRMTDNGFESVPVDELLSIHKVGNL